MTYTSYPFDNQDTTEAQYSRLFRELQDSGVVDSLGGTGLQVFGDSTGMVVRLRPGRAFVRGHIFDNDAVSTFNIAAAEPSPRIDRLVLRLDPAANVITPVIIKGVAAVSPVPTALTQTDTDVYELPIALVNVAATAPNIGPNDVVDDRRYVGTRIRSWRVSTRPASPRIDQVGYNGDLGVWEGWDGAAWRALSDANVANLAARDALSTSFATAMSPGFRARQTDKDRLWEWRGASWGLISGPPAPPVTAGLLTAGANWTLTGQSLTDLGDGWAYLYMAANRKTATTGSPQSGNIGNDTLATLINPNLAPLDAQMMTSTANGRGAFGYLNTGGAVILSAVVSGSELAAGETISLACTYKLADPSAI